MTQLFNDIERAYGKKAADLARDVTSVVRAKIVDRDMFGWRQWIDDMLVDLVGYMIADGFKHSGGGYVACGMQSAIDHTRYCSAEKRRGNYELVSLDEFYQVADNDPEESNTQEQASRLLFDVELRFGKVVADKLEPFARGYEDTLSNEVKKIVMSPEFISWFKKYTGRE